MKDIKCTCLEEPCASKVGIFKHLDHESLTMISNVAISRQYKKGEILFSPNNQSGLYIIHSGKVKLYEITSNGKEQLLHIFTDGDVVGEEALFSHEDPGLFASCLTPSKICFIDREKFMDLLLKYPSISIKLLEELSNKIIHTSHQTTSNSNQNVDERLYAYLKELSIDQDSDTIVLPMQKKELAAFLGTTPETLSRRLQYLKQQNIIDMKGKVITLRQ